MDYVGMVREFHNKMGILHGPPDKVAVKRVRLIVEEAAELVIAIDERNQVEIADAAADLVYVIAGTMEVLGMEQADGLRHAENFGKKTHTDPEIITMVIEGLNFCLGLFDIRQYARNDWQLVTRIQLSNFIMHIVGAAYGRHIPFNDVFAEVHRSNMTKQPLNEHGKGGKGPGYEPPRIKEVLEAHV